VSVAFLLFFTAVVFIMDHAIAEPFANAEPIPEAMALAYPGGSSSGGGGK
jgi:hypothetical protein